MMLACVLLVMALWTIRLTNQITESIDEAMDTQERELRRKIAKLKATGNNIKTLREAAERRENNG